MPLFRKPQPKPGTWQYTFRFANPSDRDAGRIILATKLHDVGIPWRDGSYLARLQSHYRLSEERLEALVVASGAISVEEQVL